MGDAGIAALLAFGLAVLLTPLAGIVSPHARAITAPEPGRPGRRKPHPVPLLGGMAILVAAVLPLVWFHARTVELWALLGGGAVIWLVGAVDDVRPLRPAQKLVGQVVAACTLVAIEIFGGGYAGGGHLSVPFVILWYVAIMNAFNLLDNMDGLAGGVAAITAGVIFLFAGGAGDAAAAGGAVGHVPLAAACFGAAAAGFVLFNLPPARIYLGDNGSLLLGLVLASLALRAGGGAAVGLRGVAVPVVLLAVPIFDTLFVMATRTMRGRPVTEGGQDHLSHRLTQLGLSGRRAVLVLLAISAGIGAVVLAVGREHPVALLVVGLAAAMGLGWLGGLLSRPALAALRQREAVARAVALVLLDGIAFTIAFLAAYLIRFDGAIPEIYHGVVQKSLPLFIGTKLLVFAWLDLYGTRGGGRPAGALRVLYGTALGGLLAVAIATMAWRFTDYSRAVFLIDGMITFLLALGARSASSLLGEALAGMAAEGPRIALVGSREALAGIGAVLGELQGRRGRIVGAIRLDGEAPPPAPLIDLGDLSRLDEIAGEQEIQAVWMLESGLDEEARSRVREACAREGLAVRGVALDLGPTD